MEWPEENTVEWPAKSVRSMARVGKGEMPADNPNGVVSQSPGSRSALWVAEACFGVDYWYKRRCVAITHFSLGAPRNPGLGDVTLSGRRFQDALWVRRTAWIVVGCAAGMGLRISSEVKTRSFAKESVPTTATFTMFFECLNTWIAEAYCRFPFGSSCRTL